MAAFFASAILSLASLVIAQTRNTENDSTLTDRVGWVPPKDGRSTMNIVWSCVSVLLVCTYKCVHLNISSFEENRAGWHKTKLFGIYHTGREWPLLRRHLRNVMWMAIILIAPEVGVGMAVSEYMGAREELKLLDRYYTNEKVTLTQAFYTMMGGFAALLPPPTTGDSTVPRKILTYEGHTDTIPGLQITRATHGIQLRTRSRSRGSQDSVERPALLESWGREGSGDGIVDVEEGSPLSKNVHSIQDLQLLSLNEYVGLCNELSPTMNITVTKEDISDRSKSDSFTKLFTIFQSTWLVVQSIARVSVGLPLSELELATMAYVALAVIMYGFWWDKPFGVEHVTIILRSPNRNKLPRARVSESRLLAGVFIGVEDFHLGEPKFMSILALYSTATIFSAIHLAAWNWDFASPVGRILWRTFGIIATASGPLSLFSFTFMRSSIVSAFIDNRGNLTDILDISYAMFMYVVWGAYIISRIGLIALIIYSFRFMPSSVYETVDWTDYFPFFS